MAHARVFAPGDVLGRSLAITPEMNAGAAIDETLDREVGAVQQRTDHRVDVVEFGVVGEHDARLCGRRGSWWRRRLPSQWERNTKHQSEDRRQPTVFRHLRAPRPRPTNSRTIVRLASGPTPRQSEMSNCATT